MADASQEVRKIANENINSSLAQDVEPDKLQGTGTNEITRQALAAEGWQISGIPDDMRRCRVSEPHRIPSPLAIQSDLSDATLKMMDDHSHEGLRLLFRSVRDHGREVLSNPVSNEGLYGHFCALGLFDDKPTTHAWPNAESVNLQIGMFVGPRTLAHWTWLTLIEIHSLALQL